ncbi:hypothetical protein D3C87_721660 [compost metagenome]
MRRIWLPMVLAATLLAGCGAPTSGPRLSGAETDLLTAESVTRQDESQLAATVAEIAAQFYADEGANPDFVSSETTLDATRGGLMYRSLAKSQVLRTLGYKLSYLPVKYHFSKPGKQDQVPPISAADRQRLMSALKPGDVIQCGNNGSFVHAAFYLGDDRIVHALAQAGFGKNMIGVLEEKLSDYLDRVDRDKFVVLRPRWTPETLAQGIAIARAQVGKGYDTLFVTDADDRFYCTELVYTVLTRAGAAKVEPHLVQAKWRLVTNEDLRRSPDMQVVYRLNHD